jgi:hypothetical protein
VAFADGIRNISLHRGRIHLRDNTAIISEREIAELRLANEPEQLDDIRRDPPCLVFGKQLGRGASVLELQ